MRFYVGQAFKSKKIALEYLLGFGKVMMHLDARRPGVEVPPHLSRESHLRLNLSYRFAGNDLTITEQSASSSLSFQGQRTLCVLPFDAVFAMSIDQTEMYVWLPDIPNEMAAYFKSIRLEDPDHIQDHVLDGLPKKPKPSPFKIIRGDASPDPEPPADSTTPPADSSPPAAVPYVPPAAVPAPAPIPAPMLSAVPALAPAPAADSVSPSAESPEPPPEDPPPPPKPRAPFLRIVK